MENKITPDPKEFIDVLKAGKISIEVVACIMGMEPLELIERLLDRPYTSEFDVELNGVYQRIWAAQQDYKHRAVFEQEDGADDEA